MFRGSLHAASPQPLAGALPPELEGLVEKSWLLSRRDCDENGRFEVLPDGHFGIGVVLTETRCLVIAGGPITHRITPHVGDDEIYWLRFRPGKMPRIADVHPRDLVDKPGIVLDRIRGFDFDELGERLCGGTSPNARLGVLGSFFESMGSMALCQDHRCKRVLEMVDAMGGCISVGDLSRELGMGTRMIQRLMVDQVGLTPKQLILNTRLQRTIAKLRVRPRGERLADLASECGYADQSHLIRELKRRTQRPLSSF